MDTFFILHIFRYWFDDSTYKYELLYMENEVIYMQNMIFVVSQMGNEEGCDSSE